MPERTKVKKLLFVVNAAEFFISHRLPLAIAAHAAGYEVHVATAAGAEVSRLAQLGFVYHTIPMARSSQRLFSELMSLLSLYFLFRQVRPDLVHLITIKPVLYGGIAARMAGVNATVAAVSGLGTVFVEQTLQARLRRWAVIFCYKLAFKQRNLVVIFQNPDDRDTLLSISSLTVDQVRMIRGSGVSLSDHPFLPEPKGIPVVVIAARLLRDKGVFEFVEAARVLKSRGVDVVMRMIGSTDPDNPTSVTDADLASWTKEGCVELTGYKTDVAAQYAAANIVCLPSYREGLPKALIEAAACGRAVVTTDVPGCRDAVVPGVTGLLVPVKDATAVANAIQSLVESPGKRSQLGWAGRKLAEEEFAIEKVVEQHMRIYRELLPYD